jgi:replicative DNA helicase
MDEILGRRMPHSIEAEQAVLGSIIIDSRCIIDVVSVLKPDDFYIQANRDIFETIYAMFNYSMVIDPVTLLEQMRVNGVLTDSSPSYLLDLMNITPTAANVMEYAEIVKNMSLLRSLADAGTEISRMAFEGLGEAADILEAAEKIIYSLRQDKNIQGLEHISKVLINVYEEMSVAAKSGNSISGLSSGLPDLDRIIMGLNRSDLILIASRPGMGKTSIALNIALHVAKTSGKSVAIFSLEMSKEQLALRLISSESYIDGKKLQTGRLNPDEWRKVAMAADLISGAQLYIDDNPSLSVSDMNAQCRRLNNLGLVVIDYIQLMQSATGKSGYSSENRTQVVSEISRMMKIMAKELNVPVVCLSQLSRANEARQNKRPLLSDLRESGAIEQDADIVMGLYRDDYYNKETEFPNIAECIILKNRRGETGVLELEWLPEYTTYTSIDRMHSEEDSY